LIDGGKYGERDFANVAARAKKLPSASALLDAPYLVSPLRKHDCPPINDGAAAIVLAAGDRAKSMCKRPAWIRGIDHRIEPHSLGARDLSRSPSTERAGQAAGVGDAPIEIAELHAPFSSQELIVRDALGLDDKVNINPTGGALATNPLMVAGLVRLGLAARHIHDGDAKRTLAHATSGPCLQQNLVAVLEGSS
ncbi:MAG TPA: lipid-transfer protein, partial [Polyangia bacterium]|nr:lipid-transfer protein [Polyangia bacterium]